MHTYMYNTYIIWFSAFCKMEFAVLRPADSKICFEEAEWSMAV